MNLRALYTTFDGRINRQPFWLGMIGLIIAGVAVSVVIVLPLTALNRALGGVASLLISLALLYPACALGVKRLHDRNKPGNLIAVFIAPGLVYQLADLFGLVSRQTTIAGQTLPVPTLFGSLIGLVSLIVGIWALVALGFRKGTAGANNYGPDPLNALPPAEQTPPGDPA